MRNSMPAMGGVAVGALAAESAADLLAQLAERAWVAVNLIATGDCVWLIPARILARALDELQGNPAALGPRHDAASARLSVAMRSRIAGC